MKTLHKRAKRLGFSGLGVVDLTQHNPRNDQWLSEFIAAGYHGTMEWIPQTKKRRAHPLSMWPEAKSAITLGYNYGPDSDPMVTLGQAER